MSAKSKKKASTQSGFAQSNASPTKPAKSAKPKKIFGLMTKRRWFGVALFLLGVLWSYTAGPPLNLAHISNHYYKDSVPYDYSSITKEGSLDLLNSLFPKLLFPNTFTWQIGSYFNWTQSPLWHNQRLLFTDVVTNTLYSWSKYTGIQIEHNRFVELDANIEKTLAEPGANSMIADPKNADILYVAEHGTRQIVKKNLKTKETQVVASTYQNKRFNSPQDLVFNKNGDYLYFIDSSFGLFEKNNYNPDDQKSTEYLENKSEIGFNGLYRIKTNQQQQQQNEVELISRDIYRPNAIIFNNNFNKLYVSNCINGKIDIYIFDIDNNGIKHSGNWNEKNLKWNGTKIEGGVGCTGGMTIHPKGYIFVTCPGGKICIINENTNTMEAVVKMSDNVKLSNILIAPDNNLYVTGNHTVWQIRLKKDF